MLADWTPGSRTIPVASYLRCTGDCRQEADPVHSVGARYWFGLLNDRAPRATIGRMGVTYVRAKVARPDGRGRARTVRFLVDTGAVYTVLPEPVWRALRLRSEREAEFTLADGTTIARGVSECRFTVGRTSAT